MLSFVKIKEDIINLNDIKRVSTFGTAVTVFFLSSNSKVDYYFDSEDEAKFAIRDIWRDMKSLK